MKDKGVRYTSEVRKSSGATHAGVFYDGTAMMEARQRLADEGDTWW